MSNLRPEINTYNDRYWTGLRDGKVIMPKCRACGHIQYPMGPCCSACLETAFDWIELSGCGRVGAYVVYHHAFHPSLADAVPYNVAEVLLDEGVLLLSNIVGLDNDAITNGMRVTARFEPVEDDLTLLRFAPAAAA